VEQPGTRRQRGGRKKPPVPKQSMHVYLSPEIICKLHVISEHDQILIGDLISTWVSKHWQQIKRSRKMIRPGNRTLKAIRKWAESDVSYPDRLPLFDLITELETIDIITSIRVKIGNLLQQTSSKIRNIRLARLPGVLKRIPRVKITISW